MSDHGTYAGYNEHNRNRTPVCPACRKAATDYVRNYRYRTGRVKARLVPIAKGAVMSREELAALFADVIGLRISPEAMDTLLLAVDKHVDYCVDLAFDELEASHHG